LRAIRGGNDGSGARGVVHEGEFAEGQARRVSKDLVAEGCASARFGALEDITIQSARLDHVVEIAVVPLTNHNLSCLNDHLGHGIDDRLQRGRVELVEEK